MEHRGIRENLRGIEGVQEEHGAYMMLSLKGSSFYNNKPYEPVRGILSLCDILLHFNVIGSIGLVTPLLLVI